MWKSVEIVNTLPHIPAEWAKEKNRAYFVFILICTNFAPKVYEDNEKTEQ